MNQSMDKVRHDNLISIVLVSSTDPDTDLAALNRVSEAALELFDFFEILMLAAAPGAVWLEKMRKGSSEVMNLRLIVFEERLQYDELALQGLKLSIGDFIVIDDAQFSSKTTIQRILSACLDDSCDIVKSTSGKEIRRTFGAFFLRLIQLALFAFLGRQIETNVLRPLCVSRSAAARIIENGGPYRYFRLVTLSDQFREGRVTIEGGKDRRLFEDITHRAQIVAFLVSTAAPRLLTAVAMLTLGLCMLSLSYAMYTLTVWFLLDNVREGWTSLSLAFSVLFAANFGVLSALSIGVLQVLRLTGSRDAAAPALEINNADLFANATNLNVEIAKK